MPDEMINMFKRNYPHLWMVSVEIEVEDDPVMSGLQAVANYVGLNRQFKPNEESREVLSTLDEACANYLKRKKKYEEDGSGSIDDSPQFWRSECD